MIHKVNMIHATPAERRKKAQESRILDAALELVGEEGIDALSIKGIAERADYSPGALYRYFASKDELVAALALRAVQAVGGARAGWEEGGRRSRGAGLTSRFVSSSTRTRGSARSTWMSPKRASSSCSSPSLGSSSTSPSSWARCWRP